MITEIKRDLTADLAICDAATSGPWEACGDGECSCGYIFGVGGEVYVAKAIGRNDEVDPHPNTEGQRSNMRFIAEARTGWPYAIKRAIMAEERIYELCNRNAYYIDAAERAEDKAFEAAETALKVAGAEVERLRAALSEITAATMSQYADFGHMAVSLKRIARDALYPEGTADGR